MARLLWSSSNVDGTVAFAFKNATPLCWHQETLRHELTLGHWPKLKDSYILNWLNNILIIDLINVVVFILLMWICYCRHRNRRGGN